MAAIFTVLSNLSIPADFSGGGTLSVYGTISLSGSYPAHGDTLAFSDDRIKSDYPPIWVDINEAPAAGVSQSGYVLKFVPGTTPTNGVLQVFTGAAAQSPLTELTAGAYPAGLTGAAIVARATFQSL